eukprot:1196278-Prorocentrum_minimum.AAC.4
MGGLDRALASYNCDAVAARQLVLSRPPNHPIRRVLDPLLSRDVVRQHVLLTLDVSASQVHIGGMGGMDHRRARTCDSRA